MIREWIDVKAGNFRKNHKIAKICANAWNATCIEHEHFFPHIFFDQFIHSVCHTLFTHSVTNIYISTYISDKKEKKNWRFLSAVCQFANACYSTTRGDIDFYDDQTIPLRKYSLDVVQNHAERTNSKIYAIFFSSTKGQNKGGISESRRLRDANIMFTFFFDFVSITNFSRFI